MKRIIFLVLLTAFVALQATRAGLSEEKTATGTGWRSVADFKVLKLWEEKSLGPQWPQIAVLQLPAGRQQELQRDPLAFLRTYKIFPKVDGVDGSFVLHLTDRNAREHKDKDKDPWVAIVVHDLNTYSGYGSFDVTQITP